MPLFEKNGRKVFFVHPPRTGGTYVAYCFKNSGWNVEKNILIPQISNEIRTQHYHVDWYKRWLCDINIQICFMTVRNPYTRFLSEILYQHNQHSTAGSVFRSVGYRNTGHWDGLDADSVYELSSWLIRYKRNKCDNHIRPQIEFYSDWVDYVVSQENLKSDLDAMNLDVNFLNEYRHTESDRNGKLQDARHMLLNENSKKLIYDTYREDFEKFGYEKDL